VGIGMLYDLQNRNVFSLRLKCVAGLTDVEWGSVPGFGGCNAEGSLAKRSRFDADLRTGSGRQCENWL